MLLVYKLRPTSDLETGSRSELCSSIKTTQSPNDLVLFGKPGGNQVAAKSHNNGAVSTPTKLAIHGARMINGNVV